jgi:hypothetical protein
LQRAPEARYQTTLEFAEAFASAAVDGAPPASDSRLLGKLFGR